MLVDYLWMIRLIHFVIFAFAFDPQILEQGVNGLIQLGSRLRDNCYHLLLHYDSTPAPTFGVI